MNNKLIEIRINKVNELYNNSNNELEKQRLEREHDELITRLTINDYLVYGHGLKTLIEQDYNYTRSISLDRLKTLWNEQKNMLGECE